MGHCISIWCGAQQKKEADGQEHKGVTLNRLLKHAEAMLFRKWQKPVCPLEEVNEFLLFIHLSLFSLDLLPSLCQSLSPLAFLFSPCNGKANWVGGWLLAELSLPYNFCYIYTSLVKHHYFGVSFHDYQIKILFREMRIKEANKGQVSKKCMLKAGTTLQGPKSWMDSVTRSLRILVKSVLVCELKVRGRGCTADAQTR